MRFVNGFYLLFLFSLSLGLFCSEIPESLTLTNDVSNDFVERSASATSSGVGFASVDLICERTSSLTERPFLLREYSNDSVARPVASPGPNLLLLYCIQRK